MFRRGFALLRQSVMSQTPPTQPLIAIIGATGTGKSQLAVELATRFNGEIINGDAMQMYEGLPIITNKIPIAEQKGIPHHLLGIVGLKEEPWRVNHFTRKALDLIAEIRSRGRLPIAVGGTHYYTQSLLFENAILETGDGPSDEISGAVEDMADKFPILAQPTPAIFHKLQEVDPVMASRWHPNDRRKIQRSLAIYMQTGRKASDIYEEQAQLQRQSGHVGSPAHENPVMGDSTEGTGDCQTSVGDGQPKGTRFPTLILWCHTSPDILNARLDSRVDKMIAEGLLSEIESLHTFKREQEQQGVSTDITRGIWASIGYKEFTRYLDAKDAEGLSRREKERLKLQAIEQTKAATRRYTKKQVRWIRIKLLNVLDAAERSSKPFLLLANDLDSWQQTVGEPAAELVETFLGGRPLPSPTSVSEEAREMLSTPAGTDLRHRRDLWMKQTCDVCGTVAMTEKDWMKHVASRRHRQAVKRKSGKADLTYADLDHQDGEE